MRRARRDAGWRAAARGADEWRAAAAASQRVGRGHHKAALHFGDGVAFATVSARDTLRDVSRESSLTDIPPAR